MKKSILIFVLSSVLALASDFGKIVTGGELGTYIKFGNDISKVMKNYNIDLAVISTNGSKDNLDKLFNDFESNKGINWAIIQKDVLKYYYYINKESNVDEKIKIVLPLYNEEIHIFAKKDNKINFEAGKTYNVAVSSKESGSYVTANYISKIYNVEFDFMFTTFERAQALIHSNTIDMYIDIIGIPNNRYTKIKDLTLVELPENNVLLDMYGKSTINNDDYEWLNKTLNIYTIPSVIVTNVTQRSNDKAIEAFIKILIANHKTLLKEGHNKWSQVKFDQITSSNKYHEKAIEIFKNLRFIEN